MTDNKWKPGDVALLNGDVRVIYVGEGAANGTSDPRPWVTESGVRCWGDLDEVRLLVVIDPDDREQVKRLDEEMQALLDDPATPKYLSTADLMAMALRSLATPPKPEEPTGLGAVVEGVAGVRWVRWTEASDAHASPWRRADGTGSVAHRRYADIDVVRVLTEGVTA